MSIFKFVANEMECMHVPYLLPTYVMCSFV